jgi:hypothetical protein
MRVVAMVSIWALLSLAWRGFAAHVGMAIKLQKPLTTYTTCGSEHVQRSQQRHATAQLPLTPPHLVMSG